MSFSYCPDCYNSDYRYPVSYTHLDVYKRQVYCLHRRRETQAREWSQPILLQCVPEMYQRCLLYTSVEQGKVLNQELKHNIKDTVKKNVNGEQFLPFVPRWSFLEAYTGLVLLPPKWCP